MNKQFLCSFLIPHLITKELVNFISQEYHSANEKNEISDLYQVFMQIICELYEIWTDLNKGVREVYMGCASMNMNKISITLTNKKYVYDFNKVSMPRIPKITWSLHVVNYIHGRNHGMHVVTSYMDQFSDATMGIPPRRPSMSSKPAYISCKSFINHGFLMRAFVDLWFPVF